MLDTPASIAAGAALVFAAVCVVLWRALVRAKAEVGRLRGSVAQLERERASRPSLRVTFEFNATIREALLHVTNDGSDAEVWGRISVEGALSQRVEADLRAVWRDHAASSVVLRRGETATLKLAELDLSVFPYAQWEIYGVPEVPRVPGVPGVAGVPEVPGAPRVLSLRAMHTSVIGGSPDTHAPPIFLQVALMSSPESSGPPPHSTIALQPFEAVRLRPL